MSVKTILTFVFGEKKKDRFKRILLFIVTVGFFVILWQNIRFTYDSKTGDWTFGWGPVAEIQVKKDL